MPARSHGSKWTLGVCGQRKVVREDTLWGILACKEAVLVQMFPSYHAHPVEA